MPIILKNLTVAYDGHPAIHHVNCSFEFGSLTAVTGPNGAGKSTLIKVLAGLMNYDGVIEMNGLEMADIGYLPQIHESDKSFAISVLDLAIMGYWKKVGAFRKISAAMLDDAKKTLETVGLSGFEGRAIGTLSAGQFQRALFARAMLQNAKLILLDEPFSAVDANTTADLLNIMHGWSAAGKTVIAVLHDMDQIRENFPETMLLARECVACGKTAEVLTNKNLAWAKDTMAENWDENSPVCEAAA